MYNKEWWFNQKWYSEKEAVYMKNWETEKQDNWHDITMQNYYREIAKKKNDLIKEKLTEKGFGHLVEGMEKRKFPKVICITQDKWSCYYADNDTDEGAFIVAIKDVFPILDTESSSYKITFHFEWTDKNPIINYVKY